MPGIAQEIEDKRAEALTLLQNEKENAVTKVYEQARTLLIDKSNEFNPQRDIGYIQQMQEEYDAVIQGEEQFKQNQWSLIEKIMTILVVLGLLKKTDTYDQNSSTLLDDLHGFLQDAEVAKKIMTLGLPELPKTSGQYITQGVASFQEHINAIQTALQQMKAMKTPEELENELLDVFFAKDREQGSLSSEKVLSKAGIDMVHEYRKLYTMKQQEIEQRWDSVEQERKQLVCLLVKEAKYTGVVEGNQLQNQWDAMHPHDLSDDELDEYGEKIQKQIEEQQNYQGQVTTQYTKLESIMNQLLFPEGDIGNSVTGWKVKNEGIMTERTIIRDERKKMDEENQKMIVQLQEYVEVIHKEQTIRAFEKIKQKYATIITQLKKQWTTLENTLLKTEKDEIEQKRKVLGEKLVQGVEINMQEAMNEITIKEQQYREGKNNPNFKKRVELVVQTQYLIGSIEHRMIEQGLFGLSDDDLTKLPEELATQEQEGKKIEELEIGNNIEKERKAEAIAFLTANDMDTPNNRALINAVKFTPDAIEIGGVRWSYNNLQASDVGINYSTDTKAQPKNYEEAHVFKGEGEFAQEDYFTRKAIDTLPASKKAKIPTYKDMRKTLAAIPGGPVGQAVPTRESSTYRTKGSAKILSILLGTQMSGYRRAGERDHSAKSGFLWSASPYASTCAWAFERDSSGGKLVDCSKDCAFPCRPLA